MRPRFTPRVGPRFSGAARLTPHEREVLLAGGLLAQRRQGGAPISVHVGMGPYAGRFAERIAGADFYKESADAIKASLARVEELQCELTGAYARWDDLDSRR